jgi:hypothetical protein
MPEPGVGLTLAADADVGAVSDLPFPVLDALLGVDAGEFFAADWQSDVRVFPSHLKERRLATANFDFREVIAAAKKAGKLETLSAQNYTGPLPGQPHWPETPMAASARVARAQEFAADLDRLCLELTQEVSHRVSANLYVTPPRSQGLDRHQDGHDVLILQVDGRKRWRIWKSDAPVPLDSLPALTFEVAKRVRRDYRGTPYGGRSVSDVEIEGKKEWDLELSPGDMIYVPRGWAHEVWTEDSHSAHLTFGFHLVSWVDLLMTVVAQASRRDGAFRDALPIGFARVAPDRPSVRSRTEALLARLQESDGADAMEEVIGRWLQRDLDKLPHDPKIEPGRVVDAGTRLKRTRPAAFVAREDKVGLFRPSDRVSELWLPLAFEKALRFVATVEPPEFEARCLPGVSPSSRVRLCELLLSEGYLEVAASR